MYMCIVVYVLQQDTTTDIVTSQTYKPTFDRNRWLIEGNYLHYHKLGELATINNLTFTSPDLIGTSSQNDQSYKTLMNNKLNLPNSSLTKPEILDFFEVRLSRNKWKWYSDSYYTKV